MRTRLEHQGVLGAKKAKIKTTDDDEPSILPMKKQKKQSPTATTSANSTSVVTKTLLDDANSGYKNGNFVCSPLSLDFILGMLAAGAEGQTLKQLLEFLGPESKENFLSKSPSSKLFKKKISNPKAGLECSFANGVWRDRAVDVINLWVHKGTKGLIPFIVEKSDLDRESVMLIANAMYFKGTWSDPFDTDGTIEEKFNLISGGKVSVPFMTSNKEFDYGSFEGYKMIKLPYKSDKGKSNKFSMYIFLPHEKNGLKKLLQNFHSNDALFHGEFNLTRQKFDKLWIPKFKISCNFEPKNVMKQMGLTLPFEKMNKELSGIVEPDVMLYVSKILQKSFVEIDEKGTEAGSAIDACAFKWCGKVVIAPGQGNADAKCDLDEDKIKEAMTGELPIMAQIESGIC
ncbi:serpin-ZX [Tanacetum coccineum]